MLRPSTRATWKPNVTMSVAYTAAETSVFSPATTSWPARAQADGPGGTAGTAGGTASNGTAGGAGSNASNGGGGSASPPDPAASDANGSRNSPESGSD